MTIISLLDKEVPNGREDGKGKNMSKINLLIRYFVKPRDMCLCKIIYSPSSKMPLRMRCVNLLLGTDDTSTDT